MSKSLVYLSLGSNLGDRESQLLRALEAIKIRSGIEVVTHSGFYETEPQDVSDQPWFVNLAAEIRTSLSPFELLGALRTVELDAGRDRASSMPRGPRTLDIDILLYDSLLVDTPMLTLPHPRLHLRRFVLQPLLEIAPDLVHPATGVALRDYLPGVNNQALRRIRLR